MKIKKLENYKLPEYMWDVWKPRLIENGIIVKRPLHRKGYSYLRDKK